MSTATALAAVLIAVGVVGVVVPVLPGLILVAAGILVWAVAESTAGAWTVFAAAAAVLVAGTVVKYALPGKQLRDSGVPGITLATGVLLGVIGFFVIPVVGLPIGFVLGVYLAELGRLRDHTPAWSSTVGAVRAVWVSLLIELLTGLLAVAVWIAGLILL